MSLSAQRGYQSSHPCSPPIPSLPTHPPVQADHVMQVSGDIFKSPKHIRLSPSPLCSKESPLPCLPPFPTLFPPPSPAMCRIRPFPYCCCFPHCPSINKASNLLLPTPARLCGDWAQLGTATETAAATIGGGVPNSYPYSWVDQAGWGDPPPNHATAAIAVPSWAQPPRSLTGAGRSNFEASLTLGQQGE